MLTRRRLLANTLKASAGVTLAAPLRALAQNATRVELRTGGTTPVALDANFTGLGYEMSSVAPLGLLSAHNDRYVKLVRGLGPSGVLRVGGIVANYTSYVPDGTPKDDKLDTVITRAALEQFSDFLHTLGWTAIWSVNFAQGTIAQAVAEARAVHEVLGPRLLALEIGNEVENYRTTHQPFRPKTWDYADYRKEYSQWRAAILKAAPGIAFAAPDTATDYDWVSRMAADAHGEVQLLTTHYYRNGQTRGSAEQLLTPDPRLDAALTRLTADARKAGIPWRMCETNSFSGGGRPGVSDTIVGALWTLDFMLNVAASGCNGVNIETGVNQLGFVSSYSPIQDDGKANNTAGVPYYGMLAFAQAAAGNNEVRRLSLPSTASPSLTAYGLGRHGSLRSVVVVNRDSAVDVDFSLNALKTPRSSVMRLVAAEGEPTSVTFGGAAVEPSGAWQASAHEAAGATLHLPRMSVAVLRTRA